MTSTERRHLQAALEAKRLELLAWLRGRMTELTIEAVPPDPLEWIQLMSDRDAAANVVDRFNATLAAVVRSLRAIDEGVYGSCGRCEGPIAVKRLQSIPWAAYCVRCQEQIEAEEPECDETHAA